MTHTTNTRREGKRKSLIQGVGDLKTDKTSTYVRVLDLVTGRVSLKVLMY